MGGRATVATSAGVLLSVTALVACSPDSSANPTVPRAGLDGLTITMVLVEPSSVALGEPAAATVTVANAGARSTTAPVELFLRGPGTDEVAVGRTSLFVPFGEQLTETFTFTTSRWWPATGRFEVRAAVAGDGTETSTLTTFTVESPERVLPLFEDVTAAAGLTTTVPQAECGQFANGAAWGDVDGDEWPDLLVTRLGAPLQLFVNAHDGTFSEEARQRGLVHTGANGAAFADYDNDGDADVMVVGDGPDALFRNEGDRYVEVTAAAGVAGDATSRGMSASWGDFDGDGLLDLFVTNYMQCTGEWDTAADIVRNVAYHRDALYRNGGDGSFTEVTSVLPDHERTAAGFTAAWLDADGDGHLDLYVANDFVGPSPDHNRLWHNAGSVGGGWAFEDRSIESGAGLFMNTMGVGIADLDRDGDLDMALSNIGGNKLLTNDGSGTFTEVSASGIERPTQAVDQSTVTWGTVAADFDLDGWEDLFMGAGNLPQGPDVQVGPQPDMFFLNDGTGAQFLDVSALTGTDSTGDTKGVAAADYDRDGDVDLYVVQQGGSPRLYRNVTPRDGRHWLRVDLRGTTSNRDGCGTRIIVRTDDARIGRTQLCGSGGTGSQNEHGLHVGLDTATLIDAVEIIWPSGRRQVMTDVAVDTTLRAVEPRD